MVREAGSAHCYCSRIFEFGLLVDNICKSSKICFSLLLSGRFSVLLCSRSVGSGCWRKLGAQGPKDDDSNSLHSVSWIGFRVETILEQSQHRGSGYCVCVYG